MREGLGKKGSVLYLVGKRGHLKSVQSPCLGRTGFELDCRGLVFELSWVGLGFRLNLG